MENKTANSKRLDIVGNGDRPSDQEVFAKTLKRWRQKFGYFSIFAAVPAILASNIPVAHSDEPKELEASVAEETARLPKRLNNNFSNRQLLKRQSEFRLPHQKGSFTTLSALGGTDDCPGRAIPGGNYSAAAPYVDSGNTTGANDTISSVPGYYYYFTYGAHGPDHVYSFTLTGRGPNPRIEVSTTSGTYRPLIYVLEGGSAGGCPAGTGNFGHYPWAFSDSRWTPASSTATINIDYLPLDVPFHLFIDSQLNDASGAGSYTIRMQDVTIAPAVACANPNPIDCSDYFVRQQYQDFLNRTAEPDGLQFYLDILNGCGADTECMKYTRGALSANFFRSPEFQRKGSYVIYLYMVSLGQRPVTSSELSDLAKVDRPHFSEFTTDLASISTPNDDPALTENKKAALADAWIQRPEFQSRYGGLTNADFVQALLNTAGVTISNQSQLINDLNTGARTRAQVLRAIAESPEVNAKFYKQAFVTMEYFGYLSRDPEDCRNPANWSNNDPNNCGYIFHNNRFNLSSNADLIENIIVRGFIESPEYRQRFGP